MKRLLSLLCACLMPITVGPGQDYESFTQAVYENYDNGRDIVVYPGTYDIHDEYIQLFGTDEIDNTTELGNMFQYGVRLKDRKVTFLPGAKVECIWYFPPDYSAQFCPLYVTTNVILEGLNLYAEGMEYAIHDDVWRADEPYVNEYHHCRVIGRKLFGGNCLGGGVTKNTRIIIDNCYFDNGVDESVTVRYHNTDYNNAEGEIWVSNSYFNGAFAACYYGENSHLNVYVNNCEAKDIRVQPEVEGAKENIDLFKWGNT